MVKSSLILSCLLATANAQADQPNSLLKKAEAAIAQGNVKDLEAVLDKGLDPNFTTETGEPLLIFAIGQGLFDPLSRTPDREVGIIHTLIKYHANPNIALNGKHFHSNPLIEAVNGVNPDLVQALVDDGADINSLYCSDTHFSSWSFAGNAQSMHYGTVLDFASTARVPEGSETSFEYSETRNGKKVIGILSAHGAHKGDGLELASCGQLKNKEFAQLSTFPIQNEK